MSGKRLNILMLAHFYPPEMGGAAARLHGLARWLVTEGHQVTVITGFPNYPAGVIPPAYQRKAWVKEELDGVSLLRTWVYATPKRGSLRRLLNYWSFMGMAVIAGVTQRTPFDVVLASSPPLFLGLSGWVISRLRQRPFLFDIRDLWPDVAVEAGEFAPDGTITRLGYALANFLYRRADHLTPVTENKRQKLLAAGVPASKLSVVTNGVDLDLIPNPLPPDKRAELYLNGKFIILYAGLMGIAQGVEIAIHAATELREIPEIHFLLVGDGVRRTFIAEQVAAQNLTNVTLLPRQPREAIPAFMATADVCLVPLVSSELVDAVPSKLLEAWAFGKPVILAAGGEAAEIVERSNGGLVVAPEKPSELTTAVRHLYDNGAELENYAIQGHQYVRDWFDRRQLARQMGAVLQKVAFPEKES